MYFWEVYTKNKFIRNRYLEDLVGIGQNIIQIMSPCLPGGSMQGIKNISLNYFVNVHKWVPSIGWVCFSWFKIQKEIISIWISC